MTLKYRLFIFLGFLGLTIQAQNLTVLNPETWIWGESTIEEAQFTIQPSGIYMEVGMYLTFSARAAQYISYNNKDTVDFEQSPIDLETELRFDLPLGSMVTDSWLWIHEDIIQADIEERWHATRIYEEIVGFRRDPSLLTKDNWSWDGDKTDNSYNLRVYPLQPDSTRSVKITYLTPGNWRNGEVTIPLPVDLLKASKIPVEKIAIQCFLNNDFSNPRIPQLTNKTFLPATHATLGDHLTMELTHAEIGEDMEILFDVPMQDGVFLSRYEEPERDYYQLVVLPKEALLNGVQPPRKVAVLLDYDTVTTTLSKEVVLRTLQEELMANLTAQDSFMLIFTSQIGAIPINNQWLTGDAESIAIIFNLLEEAYTISETTHLPELIEKGIEFIQNNGQEGTLFLLSCADQFVEKTDADEFIATISPQLSELNTTFHIADYQNKNRSHGSYYTDWNDTLDYYENYVHYYGNEYFYNQLQAQNDGSLHIFEEQLNLDFLLHNSLQAISPIQTIEEIKISKSGGNCFSEFTLPLPTYTNVNTPLLKVGKCVGNFPYTLDITAKVDNQLVTKTITINEPMTNQGAVNHVASWAGNNLCELESVRPYYGLTQKMVENIIEWSIKYRVLSIYTAFLALEVAEGGYVCEECVDETTITDLVTDLSGNIQTAPENEVELPDYDFSNPVRGEATTIPLGETIITATEDVAANALFEIVASPNPFRDHTTITVSLNQEVSIKQLTAGIYDINGRLVKSLVCF